MSEETIVELGGEGGSIRLLGTPSAQGWHFVLETNEGAALGMLDEDDARGHSAITRRDAGTSWETALAALDRYKGWYLLYRLETHPDFAERLQVAADERRARREAQRRPGLAQPRRRS